MYLSIGKTAVVTEQSILGIFDLDTVSQSYLTREFLASAEKAGIVENVAEDIPNSFLLCSEEGRSRIYLSQSASRTLYKRLNQKEEERRTIWRNSMN